jgi:D-lyxose ketol-isomerase
MMNRRAFGKLKKTGGEPSPEKCSLLASVFQNGITESAFRFLCFLSLFVAKFSGMVLQMDQRGIVRQTSSCYSRRMKRSEINAAIRRAQRCFRKHHWSLPPNPQWDVTDLGLGNFRRYGAVLVNLALEEEYSEKLIYLQQRQTIPAHCHKKKKEDIIARNGSFAVRIWFGNPKRWTPRGRIQINNQMRDAKSGQIFRLRAGERITLPPPVYHEFWATSAEAIIGEVSTKNDDLRDNFFINPDIGRFPEIVEDEPRLVELVSDRK